MNLNLYRCGGKWLAVDCGIGFGGGDLPEVEVMMPDPGFIAERRDRLVGLVITHAHEDHIGAVAWLWPQLKCPVYATPFAAAVLRRKLGEVGLLNQVKLHMIAPGGAFELGPFALQLHPHGALDPRGAGAGDPHRRTARCCTPATGSSTRIRWSARRPTRPRWPHSATRACWRWSAIPPMPWWRGIPGREADVRRAWRRWSAACAAAWP